MYIQQRTSPTFPLSSWLQPFQPLLARLAKYIRVDVADRRSAELAAHLQYDVGEIDYDPDRIRSSDNRHSFESQLWLHHYPR